MRNLLWLVVASSGLTFPAAERDAVGNSYNYSYSYDSSYSHSHSYSYTAGTVTTTWTERGYCSSGLDEHPSTGETTISAEACWSACLEDHGDNLVAVDWGLDDQECYCQDDCECMEAVEEAMHDVITRDDITELPAVCTSSTSYSYSYAYDDDFNNPTPAPTATFTPTASPLGAVDGYGDYGIRTAVALWLSNRHEAIKKYGHISTWETSNVTDMTQLFCAQFCGSNTNPAAASFNEDIGAWDTSGVTMMVGMFEDASSFNQDISGWVVDGVLVMSGMFNGASAFDQDLGWCVDDNVNIEGAFAHTQCASTFCGISWGGCDIPSNGNVMANGKIRIAVAAWLSDATAAEATYGHISTWATGGVTDMSYLFCDSFSPGWSCYNTGAISFNEDITAWDTSGVTSMYRMFWYASAFDQDIGAWDTSGVTTMNFMFYKASAFNQPLNDWRVDQVTNMRDMFSDASSFNQPLDGWRLDKVEDIADMFFNALAFDQVLSWCVSDIVGVSRAFYRTKCESLSCGVVQGVCPDPKMAAGNYCKLSDPELCSGSRVSFVEVPSNPFANIEDRYAIPMLAVDSDGNDDLLVGQEDGTIAFYRHVGSEFQHIVGDEDPFKSVAVGGHAAPALVDLDSDGLMDLVVGAQGGGLAFYANTGTGMAPVFTKVSDAVAPCGDDVVKVDEAECPASDTALQDLPRCDFAACGELCEGDGECGTDDSLANCGSESCESSFDGSSWIYSACDVYRKLCDARPGMFGSVTLAMTHTAPAFADIDGDGLVDLVIGKATIGALTYYKNFGSSTTAKFRTVAVTEDPFANVIVASFSKPTFYDLDNDGDQDLIVGDKLGDVLLFLNVGSRYAPEFSVLEDAFVGIPTTYAAPTFGVLNGVPSLVVGSAPGQLVVYGEAPIKLEFVMPKISPFNGIDVGFDSKPAFVDLDGDGDLDLVVGARHISSTDPENAINFDPESGMLIYYRNVGTPSQPAFEKVVEDNPFGDSDISSSSAPIFADLDNDGDRDLVVGDWDGSLNYYRNVGTASQPIFEKVDEENPFDGIDVSRYDRRGNKVGDSTPSFVDLDNDGDPDLIVGEHDGVLNYYRNVGTPLQPKFEKVGCVDDLTTTDSAGKTCSWYFRDDPNCGVYDDEDFTASEQCCACGGGLTKGESPFDGIAVGDYRTTPTLVDLDGDGDPDLVVGESNGKLTYYRNVGTPSQPSFEKVGCVDDLTTDSAGNTCSWYSRDDPNCDDYDDEDFTASEQCCACGGGSTIEESPFDGIDVKHMSAPTFADLDNDGDMDLVVGEELGRLSYFENANSCRKGLEAGACSGNGFCGSFRDGKASCECVSTFIGAQCDVCAAGAGGQDCPLCSAGKFSTAFSADCETCAPGKTSNVGASFCFDCAAGMSRSEGQDSCTACAPGTFAGAGQATCEQCDVGRFTDETGSSVCALAEPGQYVEVKGATSQTQCSSGEFSGSAASTCSLCSQGTWSGKGEAQCTSCAAGTFSGAGSATCTTCEPGRTSNSGASSCFDCPAGKLRADGEASCSPCGPGTYSEASATTCSPCGPGSFARGQENPACELAGAGYIVATSGASEQRKCAKGSFSSGSANFECTSCDAGKYADEEALDSCRPADRGHYVKDPGATKQEKCEAGTYSSGEGATSCVPANSGFFVPDEGATGQDECPAGKYSRASRATSCDECPEGEFTDRQGQSSCTPAREGHFVDKTRATEEEECPKGYHASGSGNEACTKCEVGKFAPDTGMGDCVSADPGHYVEEAGADAQKECEAGTFAANAGSTLCSESNAGSYVEEPAATESQLCPAGKFSSLAAATACENCADGSYASDEGTAACALAEAGYATTSSRRLGGARALASGEGATGQKPCPKGSFSASGSSTCTECSAGTYAASEGSTECVSAEPGYFVDEDGASEQVPCPKGKHASGASNSECSSCEAGKFAGETGRADCALAEAGYYVAEAGAAEQVPCEAGTYATGRGSSTCTTANAGSFVKDQGADKEEKCAKGTFSSAPGSKGCTDCPKGEFTNEVGRSSCTPASEGRFVDTTRATEEEVCPKGKHASGSGNEACKDCEPGKFAAEIGMGDCVSANAGNHVEGSGADEQRACEPGTYAPGDGASACTDASSGFFVAEAGAVKQMACPAGSFSSGSGSAGCEPCPRGEFNSESGKAGCTPASSGHFVASEGASQEERCPKGRHASGGGSSACAPCEPGKYADEEGLGECKAAGSGHFVSTQGATEQTPCSAGTYMADEGASKCTSANAGFFVEGQGATAQSPCLAGTFSAGSGGSACENCAAGTFSSEREASCTPCPAGASSPIGAARCTQCEAGWAKPAGEGACVLCEAGTYAGAGSDVCRAASPGYYVDKPGAPKQEPCPRGTFASGSGNIECSDCSPGSYSDTNAASACTRAKRGYFVAEPRATSPEKCEVGKYAPGEGSSSCTDANAGFFVADEAAKKQTPCPPGSYSATAASTCELCDAGTYTKRHGEASCTSCPAGASSEAGSTGCSECDRGKAKPAGPGECAFCEPGRFANKKGAGECKLADAGSFVAKSGAFEQKSCLPGTYSPGAGAVECTSCEEGRYVSRKRATACDLASGGEYIPTTGATKPFECTAGRFSGSGASSCEPCEPGTVSDAGASACTLADAGEYTNRHPTYVLTLESELTLEGDLDSDDARSALWGMLNEAVEDMGFVTIIRPAVMRDRLSSANSTEGGPNPLSFTIEANYTGVWGENLGNVSALMLDDFKSRFERLIAEGTLQERLDASDVLAPAAIDVDASLDGVRRSAVTVVRIGSPGASTGLTSDCPAGKSSQSGAFECTDCLKGTYTAEAGQDTCQPCLPFSTTTTTGEPGCFACLQGNYWIPCEAVWKSNFRCPTPPASPHSRLIPHRFEVPAGGGTEVSCSNTSALQNQCAHAEDPSDCLFSQCCKSCADLGSGVGTCNAPTGTTLEALPVERGFWRATGLEETIYRCFYERACVGSQKDEESYGDGLCREGSKGPLCTVCEHDHYFSMTKLQCEKCGSVSVLILVIVVLVVAALLAALLYASLNPGSWEACGLCLSGDWGEAAECVADHAAERQSSSASEKRKTSEGDGKPEPPRPDESTSEKKRSSSAYTKLKIVISCYQIVAGAHVLLPSIPWPLAYEQLVRIFGFASLDLSGVARTACVFPWMDYIWSMEISTVWPIVLLLLTYLACRCAKKVDEWTYFAFLLIFLVFPSNSASVLRFFNCVKFDARGRSPRTIKVLMADMSIGCRSDRYKLTRIFAWVMLVIYPVGVPVLCFAVLFWYRKRINPKSDVASGEDLGEETPNDRPGVTRTASIRKLLADTNKVERAPLCTLTVRENDEGLDRFRFLFEDYEPRCWWFAVVELIRRLYLTGLLAFFGSDEEPTSMAQTSMGLLGAIIYFIVLAHFNPYYDSADELLSKVAAVQVILTFFGATVLQAKDNSKDSEAGDPNGVYAGPIFAGVCVSVGLVTLVFALYLFLSEMKTYATKTRVGRQLSSSVDAATNYAKKRIRRIGSSEKAAKESAAEPESSPESPLEQNEPPHEDEEQPVVITG